MAAETITIGGALTVNRFGFGAMRITGEGIWGPPPDPEVARAVLRRAVELGANFIDTADAYGPDVSEQLIADALAPYPSDLVIATKGGLLRGGPETGTPTGDPSTSARHARGASGASDSSGSPLYQFHRPDPAVPLAESVGALVELQAEGKIPHVGLSNVSVDQLHEAQAVATVVSVQNRYNLADRSSEELVDECAAQGIAFLPWAPIRSADEHGPAAEIAAAHGASRSRSPSPTSSADRRGCSRLPGPGRWGTSNRTSARFRSRSVTRRSPASPYPEERPGTAKISPLTSGFTDSPGRLCRHERHTDD